MYVCINVHMLSYLRLCWRQRVNVIWRILQYFITLKKWRWLQANIYLYLQCEAKVIVVSTVFLILKR